MVEYKGYLGGHVRVDGDVVAVHASGPGARDEPVFLGSVIGTELKDASALVNGSLRIVYVGPQGTRRVTNKVVFTKASSEELLAVARWLDAVAAHNASAGVAPSLDATSATIVGAQASPVLEGAVVRAEPRDERGRLERWADDRKSKAAEKAYQKELARWRAEHDWLRQMYEESQADREYDAGGTFMLKRGECVWAVIQGVALIEPRRTPGSYRGGSQGVSIRVAKGVSYRVGAMRGQYVPGPEEPTPIDQGAVLISNQRVAFAGAKQTREWAFAKLVAVSHDPSGAWTAIQVANRQKTSGIGYGAEIGDLVRFRLELAMADYTDRRAELTDRLRLQLEASEQRRPVPPGEPG